MPLNKFSPLQKLLKPFCFQWWFADARTLPLCFTKHPCAACVHSPQHWLSPCLRCLFGKRNMKAEKHTVYFAPISFRLLVENFIKMRWWTGADPVLYSCRMCRGSCKAFTFHRADNNANFLTENIDLSSMSFYLLLDSLPLVLPLKTWQFNLKEQAVKKTIHLNYREYTECEGAGEPFSCWMRLEIFCFLRDLDSFWWEGSSLRN